MEKLKSLYADPKIGLVSKNKFLKKPEVKAILGNNNINDVINNSVSHQIHSQAKPHYLHITPEAGTFQADIMFLDQYKKFNSNYNSILNIIEILYKSLIKNSK